MSPPLKEKKEGRKANHLGEANFQKTTGIGWHPLLEFSKLHQLGSIGQGALRHKECGFFLRAHFDIWVTLPVGGIPQVWGCQKILVCTKNSS